MFFQSYVIGRYMIRTMGPRCGICSVVEKKLLIRFKYTIKYDDGWLMEYLKSTGIATNKIVHSDLYDVY